MASLRMSFTLLVAALSLLFSACQTATSKITPPPLVAQEAAETPLPTPSATPTRTIPPSAVPSPAATATATVMPAVTATTRPTRAPTATRTPRPSPTATLPPPTWTPTPLLPLAIEHFAVTAQGVEGGMRLTFTWMTTGSSHVRIISGAAQRYVSWWDVPASGDRTVELPRTLLHNPAMYLLATDGRGSYATASVTVTWACEFTYFFIPEPAGCPLHEANDTTTAEQTFQHGRMIWVQRIRNRDTWSENRIFVLYDDGNWRRYEDTWTPDEPESEEALTPPLGLVHPRYGFGKLWRENTEVRERLGWALALEQAYETQWQWQLREASPAVAYLRAANGQILELYGSDAGGWRLYEP